MAKITINHNGFQITITQKDSSFSYEIRKDNDFITSSSLYVGDGEKLQRAGEYIREVTGLDLRVDSD